MKAVILAAGRGTRMKELTNETPKPMLTVHGKTLIEHKLLALPEIVTEIILVIGYHGDAVRSFFGDSYKGKKITYVTQTELNGTGGAVMLCEPCLTERFIVMMGDDLYAVQDIERALREEGWVMVVEETDSMGAGGKILENTDGQVTGIEEGDHRGTRGLMNTNLLVLDERIFKHPPVPKAPGSSEFGLPHHMLAAAAAEGIPVKAVRARGWIQVTAPEDLARAEALLPKTVEEGS